MNRFQKVALWVGALLIVLSLALPPYAMDGYTQYAPFTRPPHLTLPQSLLNNYHTVVYPADIAGTILRWQCFVIVFLTAVALVTLAGRGGRTAAGPETEGRPETAASSVYKPATSVTDRAGDIGNTSQPSKTP